MKTVITPGILTSREGRVSTKYGELRYTVTSFDRVYIHFDCLMINGVGYHGNVDAEKVEHSHYNRPIRSADGRTFHARDYIRRNREYVQAKNNWDDHPTDSARKIVGEIAAAIVEAVRPIAFQAGRVDELKHQVDRKAGDIEKMRVEMAKAQNELLLLTNQFREAEKKLHAIGLTSDRSYKLPTAG